MRYKLLIRLATAAAICAAGLYALRVWGVSAGSDIATRTVVVSSVAAAAGFLGMVSSFRRRVSVLGAALVISGALLVVSAALVEYGLGSAETAFLAPRETVLLGPVRTTFDGFEASYAEDGEITTFRSELVMNVGSGPKNLVVRSDRPSRLGDYHVFQLGFDLAEGEGQRMIRTHLGVLRQRGSEPLVAGLAVLGLGAVVSLIPLRRERR